MINWTQQQEEAITVRGRSVIVSAAAGSGKTATLVERLLRILSDPVEQVRADSIIVVTFTKDAAAQMKRLLIERLTKELQDLSSSADTERYAWLSRQRLLLGSAKISTIHSFCFDLIREHADMIGISPQFGIATPAQESLYRSRAIAQVSAQWAVQREADLKTLFDHFCTREESELSGIILELANYLDSLAFPMLWLDRADAVCMDEDTFFEKLRDGFVSGMTDVLKLADFAQIEATKATVKIPNVFLSKVQGDKAALRQHQQFVAGAAKDELLQDPYQQKAVVADFPSRTRVAKDRQESKGICKQLCSLYTQRYDALTEQYLAPMRYFTEDAAIQKKIIPLLTAFIRDYLEYFTAEKRRQNILTFSDAEQITLELLGEADADGKLHRTPLAEALSKQYALIMVDEYQDTNNKQDCIFKLLSRSPVIDKDGLHYGNNAFLVGDVKQSIYSFRRANPDNFRQVLRESKPLAACGETDMGLIYMNQNFRSSHGVLNFVNALFQRVMTPRCGEVTYDEREQLNYGSSLYNEDSFLTTVLLPQTQDGRKGTVAPQAKCIADTIRKMLDDKVPVMQNNAPPRPCEERDFCILLRSVSATFASAVINALQEQHIAVSSDSEIDLLALPEIHLMRSLLQILDNPLTDTALAEVLLSPLYGATASDLAQLKIIGDRSRLFLQITAVANIQPPSQEIIPLQTKCIHFLELFYALRDIARKLPLEECIREIYSLTDLISLQSLYEDAAKRRAHLEAFASQAKEYRTHTDLKTQDCLSGWLRYLERLTAKGEQMPYKEVSANGGCVTLKTIHKSKGLEYPFVFVANLDKKFSKNPERSWIQASEDGLLGLHILDRTRCLKFDTAAFRYLLGNIYQQQRSEEMRLLYVALTRAKQQLFLVMNEIHTSGKYETRSQDLGALLSNYPGAADLLIPYAGNMQDWLLYFLLSDHREAQHLLDAMDESESSSSHIAAYKVWTPESALPAQPEEVPEQAVSAAVADPAIVQQLRKQLAFRYTSPLSQLVAKHSVTQLAHPNNSQLIPLRQPQFTKQTKTGTLKKLKGASRGTAVHKMLQYMDFASAAQDPAAELKRLQEGGFLNEAEAEAIPEEKLTAFFASALYARMAASPQVFKEKQLFVHIADLALPEHSLLAQQYAGTEGSLIGTMDLIFKEADSWVLVDYKTDYATKPEQLLDDYALQIGLYQKAAELLFGEPVKEAYLYSFALDRAIPVDLEKITY